MRESIVIIKLDAIGDYILFRNFLEEIKKDKKFKNYELTLVGNPIWRGLAERYDKKFVDKFFWLDLNNKKEILNELNKKNIAFLLVPMLYRSLFIKSIVEEIKANKKISFSEEKPIFLVRLLKKDIKIKGKEFYDKLIDTKKELHVFEKYRKFFEKLLNKRLYTELIIEKENKRENYAVIFPGASSHLKRWPVRNFAKISDFLYRNYKLKIMICGSRKDSLLAKKIKEKLSFNVIDLTGKESIADLPKRIAKSTIVITNDTVAAHIGAATKTKTVVVGTGIFYGNFLPYPKEYKWIKCVFPPFYFKKFHGPIWLISTKKVINKIKELSR